MPVAGGTAEPAAPNVLPGGAGAGAALPKLDLETGMEMPLTVESVFESEPVAEPEVVFETRTAAAVPAPPSEVPAPPAAVPPAAARPAEPWPRTPEPAAPSGPTEERPACTAPQLRRFIKSRAYVPMHELRRRFVIDCSEDDVTPVDLETRRVYLGLPDREGRMLGELLRAGDVGYELSLDPITPIVVGVYPMRPVPRA
jgi:hypothetical protein